MADSTCSFSLRLRSRATENLPAAGAAQRLAILNQRASRWLVFGDDDSMSQMAEFYLKVYGVLPEFVKRRINPLEYAIEDFVRSANSGAGRKVVLDAGAGEAGFSRLFDGHCYVALDSAVGDRSWDYSRIDVRGDLTAMPLAAGSVDVVINTQVLEHVPSPDGVLREICRVLKPEGKLYLTAPQGWHEHQQPHDYFRFTQYSLRKLLEGAGFEEVSVQPMGGYFHYLGQRLTYVPKVLFEGRNGFRRVVLFPLELLSLFLFCMVGPIVCYYLDRLDQQREFTLCYKCWAIKPRRHKEQ